LISELFGLGQLRVISSLTDLLGDAEDRISADDELWEQRKRLFDEIGADLKRLKLKAQEECTERAPLRRGFHFRSKFVGT